MQKYSLVKRRNGKYNSKSTIYNGRSYDSALEAAYANELDLRIKAGEIKEVIPQFKLELYVSNIHICNYYMDFKVILSDGSVEFHEVKGFETDVWRIKWKLAMAIYGKENFVLKK